MAVIWVSRAEIQEAGGEGEREERTAACVELVGKKLEEEIG